MSAFTSRPGALLMLSLSLALAAGFAAAEVPAPAAETPWLAPDGGWLAEYEVRFTGDYTGTMADPADHGLRRALEAARTWAEQEGLSVRWYSSSGGWSEPGIAASSDGAALSAEVRRLEEDYEKLRQPDGTLRRVNAFSPAAPARDYVATVAFALPQGTSGQRDELRAALLAIPGISVKGAWPLRGYYATVYPEDFAPRAVVMDGKPYSWPADFTEEEQRELWTYFERMRRSGTGPRIYGDYYRANSKLSRMPRFGLGPFIRVRHPQPPADPVVVETILPGATMDGWPHASWSQETSVFVWEEESKLPFDPLEVLRDAAKSGYEYYTRGSSETDQYNGRGYRAAVRLQEGGLTAAQLDELLAQWRAQYPELAPGGPVADAVKSGVVEQGRQPVQWQASLWLHESKLAASLAEHLQSAGARLDSFHSRPPSPEPGQGAVPDARRTGQARPAVPVAPDLSADRTRSARLRQRDRRVAPGRRRHGAHARNAPSSSRTRLEPSWRRRA